jgi:hypothetical protein
MKLELFFYVFAMIILIIIGSSTPFSTDVMNMIGSISGALVLIGVIFCAGALLFRRLRILRNRKTYGDQAEVIERSVQDTFIYVGKGIAVLWLLFVVIGFIETLKQYL